jgi:DnaJ-class molecular chaperone
MSTGSPPGDQDRVACTACRGTGRVISGLGGTPHEVTCPWCGGDGLFKPGHDAQQGEKPAPPAPA